MNKAVPVTAINSYYNEKTGEFLLLQGDENGEVVLYDISVILRKRPDLVPIDVTKGNVKRNPHREFKNFKEDAEEQKAGGAMDNNDSGDETPDNLKKVTPVVEEREILKIFPNQQMHKDVIRSIQYIDVTDKPLVMTASYDKNVVIFGMEKEGEGKYMKPVIMGTLQQGYKTMAKYQWKFEC